MDNPDDHPGVKGVVSVGNGSLHRPKLGVSSIFRTELDTLSGTISELLSAMEQTSSISVQLDVVLCLQE